MPFKPFDTGLKDIVDSHGIDYARLLVSRGVRRVRVIDADVATITGAGDKALVVESDQGEYVLHPEFQSRYDITAPRRAWWYNAVYHRRLNLPVLSVVILLRPEADGPAMTGRYEVKAPGRPTPYSVFEYDVLRLWQLPVQSLLTGGIGVLPLAPLVDDAAGQLPQVLRQIDDRLKAEAKSEEVEKLRAATSILMSLRHPPEVIAQVMKGLWPMWEQVLEDSSIVQKFVQRAEQRGEKIGEERGVKIGEERGVRIGEERGVRIGEERVAARFRETLLRLGEKRLGPADSASRAAINSIADPDRLATLSERVLEVSDWQQLLQ